MKRLSKFAVTASLLLSVCFVSAAQNVAFKAVGPSVVSVGEMFQVTYVLNAKPESFTGPEFTDFNVIAGPTESAGYSMEWVNGKTTRTEEHSYTYLLRASSPGNYTVPAGTAVVKGREYTSNTLLIEATQAQAANQGQGQDGQNAGQVTEVTADDLFLRFVVDKTNVYKGEPIRAFLKVYSRVRLSGSGDVKHPDFHGFWKEDLEARQYKWDRETYNSKVYDVNILSEYLLFPQQSGVLQIDPFQMTLYAQIVTRRASQSMFDDLFGGGPDVQEIKVPVASAPVKITVKDWPAGAPSGFNGAVGKFTMTSEMPTATINANSSANLNIRISGSGNLPLIQAPKISIPTSFEQFNTKTTESLNRSVSGITGYRQFEFPLIARAEGDYAIEPVQFSYFDPSTQRYVSLSTDEINIKVLPDSTSRGAPVTNGLVSGLSKEDIRILGQDIRFIKTEAPRLMPKGNFFMGSLMYFLILLLLLAVFVFLLVFLQKRMKEMQNVEVVRGKRANKVALQRLQRAKTYMEADNQRKFYEEMLQALWGYMSDKLNIPVAILTKDNVRETLLRKGIDLEYTNRYADLISECEYAQYSPAESGQMHDIYRGAVSTISKLESVMKR